MDKVQADNLPQFLTVADVMDNLKISKATAYKLFKRADFPAIIVGKKSIRVEVNAYIKWIDEHGSGLI
jgi:hypothetical protein